MASLLTPISRADPDSPHNKPTTLLMTGSPYFNRQTREMALPPDRWRVALLDSTQIHFKPMVIAVFIKSLLQSELWYSCGGVCSWKHELLCHLALALRAPMIIHWTGGDVLRVRTYLQKRPRTMRLLNRMVHWATAPWLVEELRSVGIEAQFVPFAARKRREYLSMAPPELPARFTVLTSIPNRSMEFYGWSHIDRLAREFSEITVNVLRATGEAVRDKPSNLSFLGWVEDTLEVYRNSTVSVRMTEHDGLTGSIQEPLALGRYAVWTYPFTGALLARDYPTLRRHIADLLELHLKGLLKPNEEGRQYMREHLDPDTLARNLERALYACVRRHEG